MSNVYWVSPTGEASWAEAESDTPLSGAACCLLSDANTNADAGDTVYLRAGTYTITDYGVHPSNSGSSGNRITFSAYNDEQVTFEGGSTSAYAVHLGAWPNPGESYVTVHGIDCEDFDNWMWMYNVSYNEISHCTFTGMYDANNPEWRASQIGGNSNYNWVHHCTFGEYGTGKNNDDYGVPFDVGHDQSTSSFPQHNVIEECTFYHGAHHCLGVQGKYNTIRNNYLHNEKWWDDGAELWGGRVLYSIGNTSYCEHNMFEGNRVAYGGQTTEPDDPAGVGFLLSSDYNIVRYNAFVRAYLSGIVLHYSHGAVTNEALLNAIYNNTFWYCGYYEGDTRTSGQSYFTSICTQALVIEEDHGDEIVDTIVVNNIFYQNNNQAVAHDACNTGDDGAYIPEEQDMRGNWLSSDGDPKFTDISGTPPDPDDEGQYNLTLQSDSPCINGGTYITQANGSGSSSTTLVVDNANPFQDGWGNGAGGSAVVEADHIAIGTVGNTVQISSINYSTNTITLASPMTWSDDANIWLYKNSKGEQVLFGTAPDQGANPYNPEEAVALQNNGAIYYVKVAAEDAEGRVSPYSLAGSFRMATILTAGTLTVASPEIAGGTLLGGAILTTGVLTVPSAQTVGGQIGDIVQKARSQAGPRVGVRVGL